MWNTVRAKEAFERCGLKTKVVANKMGIKVQTFYLMINDTDYNPSQMAINSFCEHVGCRQEDVTDPDANSKKSA